MDEDVQAHLGSVTISGIQTATKIHAVMEVVFTVDKNGILTVTASQGSRSLPVQLNEDLGEWMESDVTWPDEDRALQVQRVLKEMVDKAKRNLKQNDARYNLVDYLVNWSGAVRNAGYLMKHSDRWFRILQSLLY